ncbi:MAG: hypothetical protein EKK48_26330 [Candidatus Melainabacteria bacterium]|nr:MAG: hypothetical protein EKK48_26330 [Candidatus Melainabacteria bacterium]
MRKPTIVRLIPYVVLVAVAVPFLALGLWLGDHEDRQVKLYNQGILYANKRLPEKAAQAFKASAAVYLEAEQLTWLERFFLPRPDPELAALAYSHLGYMAYQGKQVQAALQHYRQSLAINSGAEWLAGTPLIANEGYAARACANMPESPIRPNGQPLMEGPDDVCRLLRMRETAMTVVFNYELLKQRPQLGDASKEGSGRKKGKPRLDKPKPVPALAPGGKGNTAATQDGY